MGSMTLHSVTLIEVGIFLLALITVESGGVFLAQIASGRAPATEFQRSFFRAGHAHAGVLLVLALVVLVINDSLSLPIPLELVARFGVPAAALALPGGFFLSAIGGGRTRPNRLIGLVWVGAALLTAGLLTTGVAAIVTGAHHLGAA